MPRPFLKHLSRSLMLVFALAGSLLTSGCFLVAIGAAAGAGAGTAAYVDGKLTANVDQGYDVVVHGSDQAVAQLQFLKVSEARDALSAVIQARTAEDKKVTIVVTRVADNQTRVEIRVGVFGSKAISMTILDRIKANI